MSAIIKIRSALPELPQAERRVAEFILKNPKRATHMVINDIAKEANVSLPSVTRLAKKLGYEGFLDFRVALAEDKSVKDMKSGKLTIDTPQEEAINLIFKSFLTSISDSLNMLDKDMVIRFTNRIHEAKSILICGFASSAGLAVDVCQKLNLLGIRAISVTDPTLANIYACRLGPEDVFIGISRSGKTKLVLDALRMAVKCGAHTGFISNYLNSPASLVAEYFICTSRNEEVTNVTGLETNISQDVVFNAIYTLLSLKRLESARK